MTWVKLPNTFAEDHRWLRASSDAFALHVAALCYSDRNLRDGAIEAGMVPRLSFTVPPEAVADAVAELLEHGFWTTSGDGYRIEDYTDFCFDAEQVKRVRDRWSTDKKRQAQHKIGDHSLCTNPKYCPAVRSGSTVESGMESTVDSSASTRPDTTRPNSTRPKGRGELVGGSAGPASASATSDRATEAEESPITSAPTLPRNFGATCDCPNGKYVEGECIRCGGGIAA